MATTASIRPRIRSLFAITACSRTCSSARRSSSCRYGRNSGRFPASGSTSRSLPLTMQGKTIRRAAGGGGQCQAGKSHSYCRTDPGGSGVADDVAGDDGIFSCSEEWAADSKPYRWRAARGNVKLNTVPGGGMSMTCLPGPVTAAPGPWRYIATMCLAGVAAMRSREAVTVPVDLGVRHRPGRRQLARPARARPAPAWTAAGAVPGSPRLHLRPGRCGVSPSPSDYLASEHAT